MSGSTSGAKPMNNNPAGVLKESDCQTADPMRRGWPAPEYWATNVVA
jgi:hypothetical protein